MPITPTDIANRACQKVGAARIALGALLTENTRQAGEIRACYDMLRRSELRRNVWRFSIRTCALRAMDNNNAKIVTFGNWVVGTTYSINDVITGDDGQIYFSRVFNNTGNTPSTSPLQWELYFGPDVATEFVTTWGSTYTYEIGDSTVGSDGNVYTAIEQNQNHNPVSDGGVHWALASTYPTPAQPTEGGTDGYATFFAGELVHIGDTVFLSLQNNNGDGNTTPGDGLPPPSATWLNLTTQPTIALPNFIYPIGTSPSSSNDDLRNVFRLPVGYMREAPQDPKAGGALFLGAPDGSEFNDWDFESDYFTSSDTGPLVFRFAADVQDPTQFDPMFVEGFACRIGMEVCEILTQSTAKVVRLENDYKMIMGEARIVNGIENGPTYPPEDSYITTRQ
jgi:hypothetical protein